MVRTEQQAMMGSKTFQPKGVYHLNLEERIPADHLVRPEPYPQRTAANWADFLSKVED